MPNLSFVCLEMLKITLQNENNLNLLESAALCIIYVNPYINIRLNICSL